MEQRRTFAGGQARPRLEMRRSTRGAGAALPMIVGYASVFYDGTPGTQYQLWPGCVERIIPGAFAEAIKGDVAALRNHDDDLLLGRTTANTPTLRLREDRVGLRYEIDPPDTSCGRETVSSIKRGDMRGSSFGFSILDESWREETMGGALVLVREIRLVRLFDVGPVTFPAYKATSASVGGVAGGGGRGRGGGGISRDAIAARLRVLTLIEAQTERVGPSLSRDAIRARARVVEMLEAA